MARIRTIKPDFWTDEKLSECSLSARLLFIGLWTFADDEGRMEYNPARLRMQIFPDGSVKDSKLIEMIGELSERSVIRIYVVDGKQYLDIPNFVKHQKINRPTPSKIPVYSPTTHGELSEDSHTELELELEGKGNIKHLAQSDDKPIAPRLTDTPAKPNGKIVHELGPLNDGTSFPVTESQLHFWRQTYPAVDVEAELREMNGWLDSHPAERKTRNGAKRFANGWLSRAQNRPRKSKPDSAHQPWKGAL